MAEPVRCSSSSNCADDGSYNLIDEYLNAVTSLEPVGNPGAEVAAAVSKLQKDDPGHAIQRFQEQYGTDRAPVAGQLKALDAFDRAKIDTLLYLGRLDRGDSEDRKDEEKLARLGSRAARAFVGIDPSLVRLLNIKAASWARPAGRWDDNRAKKAGIAIEDIGKKVDKIVSRWADT